MAKIIHNLSKFTQDMIDLISSKSTVGKKHLEGIFSQAHAAYDEPKGSYVWGWIYGYSRQRSKDFDLAEHELAQFPDPLLRLQTLLKFISEGNWTSTSGNTRLFIGLINGVSGYDKETDEYLYKQIIEPVKSLLKEQIELVVKTQQNQITATVARQRELDLINENKGKEFDEIVLFDKENDARVFAKQPSEKYAVYFVKNKTNWYLGWYDRTGKKELLLANKELQILLRKQFIAIGAEDKIKAKIKTQCRVLLEEFLGKINLLLNPKPHELEGLVSAFVVDEKAKSLTWHDSLGRAHPIDLKKYPLLDDCLKTMDLTQKNNELWFKSLLLRVPTRHAVDNGKQVSILQLMQKRFGCEILLTNDLAQLPAPRMGSYILTKEKAMWALYRWENGAANAVDTDAWVDYHALLEKLGDIQPSEIQANEKASLRHIITQLSMITPTVKVQKQEPPKPISKINVAEFFALEKCLGGHAAKVKTRPQEEKTVSVRQDSDKQSIAAKKKQLVSKFSAVATLFGASLIDDYGNKPAAPVVTHMIDDYLPPPPEMPDELLRAESDDRDSIGSPMA